MARTALQTLSVPTFDSSIVPLNGENYIEWKEKLLLLLGCMDLNLAIRVDEPPKPTESNTQIEKTSFELWERSNRLSLMFIKSHIGKSIHGSIPEYKTLAITLINQICSMKLTDTKGVSEHIMQMRDMAARLKSKEI
ncbi:uncharacterized protein [Aristolochia californica]|uniref:uncharacterized protein n=1 Tax=Aristolochia californica TaxID=171875 RepID=UPI0035D78F98